MTASTLAAVDGRVRQLENAFPKAFEEIKNLIREEIRDLKNEQLADIKKSIDRVENDLKLEHGRLADDQRRLWDRVGELEKRENQRYGAGKWVSWLSNLAAIAMSGGVGAFLTYLLTGRAH